MNKLYVVFSEEARNYVEDHGFEKLAKQKKLSNGYDWQLKEFASKEIMDAYTQGLADAQGWDMTDYCELTVENELLPKPKYILKHVDDISSTEFFSDDELVNYVSALATQNASDELITTVDEATEYVIDSCENLTLKFI